MVENGKNFWSPLYFHRRRDDEPVDRANSLNQIPPAAPEGRSHQRFGDPSASPGGENQLDQEKIAHIRVRPDSRSGEDDRRHIVQIDHKSSPDSKDALEEKKTVNKDDNSADGNKKSDHQKDEDGKKSNVDTDGADKEGDNKEGDNKEKSMPPEKKRFLIIVAIVVGLFLIICGTLYWLHARHYEDTDDAFIDGHVSQISSQVSGRVEALDIVDNQQVEVGQLLLEIDPRDYEEKLAETLAQKQQAIAQVDLQRANLNQAEANVAVAAADVFQTHQDLNRYEHVDPKAVTRQQLDNAIAAAQSADAKLDASQQAVHAGAAQIEVAEANLQEADVEISNAKLQLSYTKIVSPIAGRVTRRTVEVGNVIAPETPLLAIVSNDLWVTANYKETQLDYMRVGQKVRIKIDAFPGIVFSGHVDSFQKGTGTVFSTLPAENATGNYVKVVQRVPVKILFDDPDKRDQYPIAPGLSVDPRTTVR